MKRIVICLGLLLLLQIPLSGVFFSHAQEPVEGSNITMHTKVDQEKVARPVVLPHLRHQWLECTACHHGKNAEGQKTDFVYGQEVQTCETCHNSRLVMPKKVGTFKRAGHQLCMECHRQADAALTKCGVCHPVQ